MLAQPQRVTFRLFNIFVATDTYSNKLDQLIFPCAVISCLFLLRLYSVIMYGQKVPDGMTGHGTLSFNVSHWVWLLAISIVHLVLGLQILYSVIYQTETQNVDVAMVPPVCRRLILAAYIRDPESSLHVNYVSLEEIVSTNGSDNKARHCLLVVFSFSFAVANLSRPTSSWAATLFCLLLKL